MMATRGEACGLKGGGTSGWKTLCYDSSNRLETEPIELRSQQLCDLA
jgi:hypothetical protein